MQAKAEQTKSKDFKQNKQLITHGGGAKREDKSNKIEYNQIPVDMLTRLATHYTEGGKVHGDFNWFKGDREYMENMKKSAYRHFIQWFSGETDEDHAMALVRNVFSYEMLKLKLEGGEMSKYMQDVLFDMINDND